MARPSNGAGHEPVSCEDRVDISGAACGQAQSRAMSLAYYKRFPRDFLDATIGFSFEEKGAYSIILDLIYARDGNLPDDARFISGVLNCSIRKWATIRASLIGRGKLDVKDGFITNKRADNLLETSRRYQDNQTENARTPRKNNDLEKPSPSHSRDYPEPEPERKKEGVLQTPTKEAPPRASRGARISADWIPSDEDRQFALAAGLTEIQTEREIDGFRDYWLSRSRDAARSSWSLTFRNRIRDVVRRREELAARAPTGGGGSGVTDFASIVSRRYNASR